MRYLSIVDKWNNKSVRSKVTGLVRRYCCLVFRAEILVKQCNATLELIDIPKNAEGFHSLHWADGPYTYKAFSESKDIKEGGLARLDIIFTGTPGDEANNIGASGASFQPEVLDEASTVSASGVLSQPEVSDGASSGQGAWIATPISLSWPLPNNQDYLPSGKYRAKLLIVNEKGNIFAANLILKSPKRGEEIEVEIESVKDFF